MGNHLLRKLMGIFQSNPANPTPAPAAPAAPQNATVIPVTFIPKITNHRKHHMDITNDAPMTATVVGQVQNNKDASMDIGASKGLEYVGSVQNSGTVNFGLMN